MNPESPNVDVETNTWVTMRDGVRLATDIYRPHATTPLPAVVYRTPYNKADPSMVRLMIDPIAAAQLGYVVVVQDTRGRYQSEGDFRPFVSEGLDGYDTIEWAAQQPWCDGNVGMYGSSGMGMTTLQAAATAPPHLKAIFAYVTGANLHNGFIYGDGVLQFGFSLHWALSLSNNYADRLLISEEEREMVKAARLAALEHRWDTVRHLPLTETPGLLGDVGAFWREWLEHPAYDEFWKAVDVARRAEAIKIPVLHISGWYDVFLRGHLDLQLALQRLGGENAADHRLILGPWDHGAYMDAITKAGSRDFGGEAISGPLLTAKLFETWFGTWLKGEKPPVQPSAPVRYFMMGVDKWMEAESWPPPFVSQALYLDSNGRANSRLGDGTLSWNAPTRRIDDTFTYDPNDPVPSVGGHVLQSEWAPSGVHDQSEVELRPDVLVYTSQPLNHAVAIAGPIAVVLYASTSCEDTDFTAKLVDLEPSGYCANIVEGVVRARYRNGHESEDWITPGQMERFDIDLWDVAHTFRAGHSIRLEISSSNFPTYERNLNSRATPQAGLVTDIRVATQIVAHGENTPSCLVLPVLS